ncbi:uncharacterized protein RJT20DRAFT_141225 [Scheffersomyces xylosifermentans]|uniref:uncharacterized protein n=1 Tax=Scheffersomyces xylosifermentans TaxID=1304137 RepID=UPI00315C749D
MVKYDRSFSNNHRTSFRISKSKKKAEIPGTSVLAINTGEIPGSAIMTLDKPLSNMGINKGSKSSHSSLVFMLDKNNTLNVKKKDVPGTSIIRIIQKKDNYINSATESIKYPELSGKRMFTSPSSDIGPTFHTRLHSEPFPGEELSIQITNAGDYEVIDHQQSPAVEVKVIRTRAVNDKAIPGKEITFAVENFPSATNSSVSTPLGLKDNIDSLVDPKNLHDRLSPDFNAHKSRGSRSNGIKRSESRSPGESTLTFDNVAETTFASTSHISKRQIIGKTGMKLQQGVRKKQENTLAMNIRRPHTNLSPGKSMKFKLHNDKRHVPVPGTSIIFQNNEITNLGHRNGAVTSGVRMADQGSKSWQIFTVENE